MPVPTQVSDLSTTIASNAPAGSDNVFPDLDNHIRALAGMLASVATNSATNGYSNPYLPNASAAVFNETGADIDFRAEGDTDANLLFLDASTDRVGVGTNTPDAKLTVNGVGAFGDGAVGAPSIANTGDLNTGIWFPAADTVAVSTGGVEAARFDSSGNLGLGVTPSANAYGSAKTFFVSGDSANGLLALSEESISATSQYVSLMNNAYPDGASVYKYKKSSQVATSYRQNDGAHSWFTAPSGTAGNAISFTQALTLDANRNLLLNGTTAGASSVGTFTIFNGTAPTGSVIDGVILFAQDIASSSELRVRDEAGNVTTLSPHNFSLIPEGPSEEMAWAYYSEKGGKRINVDMLKLARMVEKLTGEKLVYES